MVGDTTSPPLTLLYQAATYASMPQYFSFRTLVIAVSRKNPSFIAAFTAVITCHYYYIVILRWRIRIITVSCFVRFAVHCKQAPFILANTFYTNICLPPPLYSLQDDTKQIIVGKTTEEKEEETQ